MKRSTKSQYTNMEPTNVRQAPFSFFKQEKTSVTNLFAGADKLRCRLHSNSSLIRGEYMNIMTFALLGTLLSLLVISHAQAASFNITNGDTELAMISIICKSKDDDLGVNYLKPSDSREWQFNGWP
ncbi:hypothetical protein O6H91_21G014400 [Diphasiastrum complanatum]|uniref:Uncharacterized protein n=1 Tax=Diphasiastrum complanatum TaxID=34168 RepID=A0ACC2AI02_DIPCM|nr:hypothetical protein O6H91_21G014400 [Diphasiastrum complanatum]